MLLKLSVVTYQEKAPHFTEEFTFGVKGGSIGRGTHNDWVLEDPHSFLSKQHASISFHLGSFTISDHSTNGVFINHRLLGKGGEHTLTSSDHIKMGDYEIIVSELDLFENNSENFPFTEDIQKSTDDNHSSFTFKTSHESTTDDPFDDVFNPRTNDEQYEHHVDSYANSDNAFSFDSNLKQQNPVNAEFYSYKKSDSSNKPEPEGSSTEPNLPTEEVAFDMFAEPKEPHTITEKPPSPFDQKPANEELLIENIDKLSKPNSVKSLSDEKPDINKADHSPPSQNTPNHSVLSKPQDTSINQHALEQILIGAGFSVDEITLEANDQTFKLIGSALKASLDGTMSLLRSRTEAKNHLRLDKTLIGSQENNPLKFFPSSKHVLKLTFVSKHQVDNSYLPLITALQEAYDDIRAHEFSMTASIQKALSSTIKMYFSPENIQSKLEKNNPISAKIPLQREAKLWHLFTDIYDEIAEEACDSFQTLLDKEIAKAYEAKTKELKT